MKKTTVKVTQQITHPSGLVIKQYNNLIVAFKNDSGHYMCFFDMEKAIAFIDVMQGTSKLDRFDKMRVENSLQITFAKKEEFCFWLKVAFKYSDGTEESILLDFDTDLNRWLSNNLKHILTIKKPVLNKTARNKIKKIQEENKSSGYSTHQGLQAGHTSTLKGGLDDGDGNISFMHIAKQKRLERGEDWHKNLVKTIMVVVSHIDEESKMTLIIDRNELTLIQPSFKRLIK